MPVNRTELVSGWELRLAAADPTHRPPALPATVPAVVPGCVHTDLLAAGLISDPYLDENELVLAWIGHRTWSYRTEYEHHSDGANHVDLVCDGLDTVATVLVNGREVGRFVNQHRAYRIPVAEVLRSGRNEIEVVFDSAWAYAESVKELLGDLPTAYLAPFNFIRKMACNFGWDWGPALVTAGIWKPIAIETWSTARLSRVLPTVSVVGADGRIELSVDVDRAADRELAVTATIAGVSRRASLPAGESTVRLQLEVPGVELWWPHDLGGQPRYDLVVELSGVGPSPDANPDARPGSWPDDLLDSWRRQIGFRTVALDTREDAVGSAFTLVVNDVPIFVRGANWIPDDCFPSRITRERLRTRVGQGIGAHVNLLRVWGGGIYESDDFYDLCDELGVLVWQDFLFACAAYPEEDPVRGEVIAEAAENVARLMPHPSLVLWNGGNENLWGWFDWGWQEPVGDRTWGAGYYFDLLPAIVAEIDPGRPYYPGSPFSGTMDIHPNDPDHGLRHSWDVWNQIDYRNYRNHVPRFVAEFGYQGPPNISTIRRSIHDQPLTPTSPGMAHHQKAEDGDGKLARGAEPHLPIARTFEQWHYLMQLNQAEAVRFGIEHFRSHRGVCMGSVLWQLNDCWPVTSWAAIDGDGKRKLLWYALRAAYAPRLLTMQPREGGISLIGVNDTALDWRPVVTLQRLALDGTRLATQQIRLGIDRWSAAAVPLPPEVAAAGDPAAEFLVASATGGERTWWFYVEDKKLALRPAGLATVVQQRDDGIEVTVRPTSLARHVAVLADRWHPEAVADEALLTLLPGRSHTFRITAPERADPDSFTASGALTCLNDILAAPG